MAKILFISQDPGGTNVLVPVIKLVHSKCEVTVIAKGNAANIYKRYDIPYVDANSLSLLDENGIMNAMLRYDPDLVITDTGASDFFERNIWDVSKQLGIKTVAILDSWCNYGLRFSNCTFQDYSRFVPRESITYLPEYILAMDNLSKEGLIADGVPGDIIKIVGHPYLQMFSEMVGGIHMQEVDNCRLSLTGDKDKKIILFASDNLSSSFSPSSIEYWGYDEKSIFKSLYNAIVSTCINPENYTIVIRPHPKEDIKDWERYLAEFDNGEMSIIIDSKTPEEIIIASSDIVFGMWTMLMCEAALANKKVVSLQMGRKRKAEFVLEYIKALTPILYYEDLETYLRGYFNGGVENKGICWDLKKDSVQTIVNIIMEMISGEKV